MKTGSKRERTGRNRSLNHPIAPEPLHVSSIARSHLACAEPTYRQRLLPLNGRGWFAGDVEADAVDAFAFVGDAGGDAFEDFVGQLDPVGGHAVLAFDDAQSARKVVGAFVALDADAADGEEDSETLPDFVIPAALFHFVHHDPIGIAQDVAARS